MVSDYRPRTDASSAAPAAPAAPGEIIGGKYRVEECIGYGGMGVVCAATHLELERKLAIKFVRPEFAQSEEFVLRFLNEARAAAALRSEHVAQVLDCGRLDSGTPFIVLEHLVGADLESIVGRRGPLPVELAVDLSLQLCVALAEAHRAHIIHRDIKPQNLFVTEGPGSIPLLKVLDFGVSKRLSAVDPAVTQTSQAIGSPQYMSPEQMSAPATVDARTDIWSFGAVLFELLAGRPPFTGETIPEICAKVVSQPAPFIRSFRPNVPPRLESIVQRCLEKDREQRFADVAELAEVLVPFASAAGVASADLVARIFGREPPRRSLGPLVVPDDLPSTARSDESIPGVRKSRLPLIAAILLFAGALAFSASQLLGGGVRLNVSRADTVPAPDAGLGLVTAASTSVASARSANGTPAPPPDRSSAVRAAASAETRRTRADARAEARPEAQAETRREVPPSSPRVTPRRSSPKLDAGTRAAPESARDRLPVDPRDIDPPGIGTVPIPLEPAP